MSSATAVHRTSCMGGLNPSRRSHASFACLLLGVFALASVTPASAYEPEPILNRPTQISGIAQVGQQLTATPAVWSVNGYPSEGTISVFDRCSDSLPSSCKVIPGTQYGYHIYLVTPEDVGFVIRAWSNLTVIGWSLGSQSEATAVVTAGATPPPTPTAAKPTNTVLPKIKGKAKTNNKLTVSSGTWRGSAPIRYKYQWKSCDRKVRKCQAIRGATKNSLRISLKYRGRRLVVAVTATNAAGRTTVTSKATGVVVK